MSMQRVYHFLNEQYGLEALERRRLKVSRISELNDPFEFMAVNLADRKLRSALRLAIQEQDRESGLICFSKKWSNPLLWSHYADKHRGICLGFDVPQNLLTQIVYVDDRVKPDIPALGNERDPKIQEQVFEDWLHSKLSDWKYEDEVRAFVKLKDQDQETGFYFKDFDTELRLREVILGCKSCLSRSDVKDRSSIHLQYCNLIKARAAFKSYKVVKRLDW